MTCEKVQNEIISGKRLCEASQMHLLGCSHCQDFSAAYCALQANGLPKPSKELDAAVSTAAWGIIHPRLRLFTVKNAASIAAALILLLGIFALNHKDSPHSEDAFSITSNENWLINCIYGEHELMDLEDRLAAGFLSNSDFTPNYNTNLNDFTDDILSLELDLFN